MPGLAFLERIGEVVRTLLSFSFRFTLFHENSWMEIQSVGIRVLDNIIRTLNENGVFAENEYTFQTFRQRFLDECAGVFTNVALSVPVSDLCEETYADFNNDFNVDFAIGGDGVKIY